MQLLLGAEGVFFFMLILAFVYFRNESLPTRLRNCGSALHRFSLRVCLERVLSLASMAGSGNRAGRRFFYWPGE